MSMTAYAQKKLGDHAIASASYTMPTAYLGIFAASPGETGSLASEISGGSYARVPLAGLMGAADATSGIATNSSAVTFAAPTAAWGLTAHLGIIDSVTLGAGNVLFYAPMANPRVVNNGDTALTFGAGSLSVSIAGSQSVMISSYLMKKLVDHILGTGSYTMPAAVYHGLLGSNPTIAGTLTSEVPGGGYLRQPLAAILGAFDALTGISTSVVDVTYPTPIADYPDVNYSFIADSPTALAGNLLFAGQLPSVLSIKAATAPALFPAGSIRLSIG